MCLPNTHLSIMIQYEEVEVVNWAMKVQFQFLIRAKIKLVGLKGYVLGLTPNLYTRIYIDSIHIVILL